MNFISQFDAVVTDMMALAGGTAILRIFSDGSYSDGEIIRTSEDHVIKILINDYPQANVGDKSKFGTLIEASDKEVLIQEMSKADPYVTQPNIQANRDLIIINGTEWKILALKEINPSGVNAILFDMHLRR